ncbi:MAG: hypothetical protein RLZZ453_388 [Chlamydiota bacterium]|jgi:hypothetical protein
MRWWVFIVLYCSSLLNLSTSFAAEDIAKKFISQSIQKISLDIQNAPSFEYAKLSDLFASRGEDYLILGEDIKALQDFELSHVYASKCDGDDLSYLLFRPLFGAFLVCARLENIENLQNIYNELQLILDHCTCYECEESATFWKQTRNENRRIFIANCNNQPDWPILGPERISMRECLDRVEATAKELRFLVATIQRAEIQILAIALIDQLELSANRCCRAGGLWKGCLQKLVNKLHYWRVLGIPADPMWD